MRGSGGEDPGSRTRDAEQLSQGGVGAGEGAGAGRWGPIPGRHHASATHGARSPGLDPTEDAAGAGGKE